MQNGTLEVKTGTRLAQSNSPFILDLRELQNVCDGLIQLLK